MYEALDGNRCNVSTGRNPELTIDGGYDENMGSNASFGLVIPLGDKTTAARQQCETFARQDQGRQHFMWLLEMYESGVITRDALNEQAESLGMKLAPEERVEATSSAVIISPR